MQDSTRYVDRIVVPYSPRIVVVYAGDNDIMGTPSEQIVIAFERFVRAVHAKLPDDEDSLHRHQAEPAPLGSGGSACVRPTR
jgi:hypothetical protein